MKKKSCPFVWISVLVLLLFSLICCQSQRSKERKAASHHCNLGKIYFQQGRIQEAIAEVKMAMSIEPKNPEYSQWLGIINFSAGNYSEAEEAYLQALKADPYLTEVHNYLGVLYDQMGKREDAFRHFEIALRDRFYRTPESVYFNRSQLYEREGNIKEAIEDLRRAVEKSPKFYRGHYQLAKLLDRIGNYKEALFEYRVAEAAYKQDFDFHFLFAMTCMKDGNKEEAQVHFRRVIDLAPGTPSAIKSKEILDTLK
ncbi:MAG: tetratricopeptide repeat protein [Acidobacteriota bacterium]